MRNVVPAQGREVRSTRQRGFLIFPAQHASLVGIGTESGHAGCETNKVARLIRRFSRGLRGYLPDHGQSPHSSAPSMYRGLVHDAVGVETQPARI